MIELYSLGFGHECDILKGDPQILDGMGLIGSEKSHSFGPLTWTLLFFFLFHRRIRLLNVNSILFL